MTAPGQGSPAGRRTHSETLATAGIIEVTKVAGKTLFDKVWEAHVVVEEPGKPPFLYIDLHLLHEVTSPQAFEGLRLAGRRVRRPDLTFATMDHNVPHHPQDSRPAPEPGPHCGPADGDVDPQLPGVRDHPL